MPPSSTRTVHFVAGNLTSIPLELPPDGTVHRVAVDRNDGRMWEKPGQTAHSRHCHALARLRYADYRTQYRRIAEFEIGRQPLTLVGCHSGVTAGAARRCCGEPAFPIEDRCRQPNGAPVSWAETYMSGCWLTVRSTISINWLSGSIRCSTKSSVMVGPDQGCSRYHRPRSARSPGPNAYTPRTDSDRAPPVGGHQRDRRSGFGRSGCRPGHDQRADPHFRNPRRSAARRFFNREYGRGGAVRFRLLRAYGGGEKATLLYLRW